MTTNEIEQRLNSIQSTFRFRETQTQQIFHYINLAETGNIVAYGPRATGKTSVIRAVARRFELFHAWIDVLHHVSVRSIYASILKQIGLFLRCSDDSKFESDMKNCQNAIVFIEKLSELLTRFRDSNMETNIKPHSTHYRHKLIIVFDHIDALFRRNDISPNAEEELIYLMNNLEHLSRRVAPISVLYISTHSIEWLMRQCDFKPSALQIVFNNYSNEELQRLLSAQMAPDARRENQYSDEFYSNYVNIVLKSLTPFTRNFIELRSACIANFAQYIAPILENEFSPKDLAKLYMRFQPRLQQIIEQLPDHKIVRLRAASSFQMSPSANYLLIAAYLATYNSAKSDKRYFVRNQGRCRPVKRRRKMTQSGNKMAAKADLDDVRSAPKSFTFERLYNIYQALLRLNENDRAARSNLTISTLVFEQFHELIKQNLIFATSLKSGGNTAISLSSSAKYQFSDAVSRKQVDDIAFSLQLNLRAFVDSP